MCGSGNVVQCVRGFASIAELRELLSHDRRDLLEKRVAELAQCLLVDDWVALSMIRRLIDRLTVELRQATVRGSAGTDAILKKLTRATETEVEMSTSLVRHSLCERCWPSGMVSVAKR
jgi:hypothetical protein